MRDHREIALTSTSSTATGSERTDTALFSFDRVFAPRASQGEVFEDIGQLVQSVTDGYNCTIFSYGQTGSGKTWTMEGGKTPETMGMIPRAVRQVFETAESSGAQGWDYTMEGQFLEIVRLPLRPFLRLVDYYRGDDSTTRQSTIYSGRVNSTNASTRSNMIRADGRLSRRSLLVRTALVPLLHIFMILYLVPLTSPGQVASLLQKAQSRRAVATTWMNERSSRSHSIFTLRVSGVNRVTNEACDGCLNLVVNLFSFPFLFSTLTRWACIGFGRIGKAFFEWCGER